MFLLDVAQPVGPVVALFATDAGVYVGAALLIALTVVVTLVLIRRKRKNKKENKNGKDES